MKIVVPMLITALLLVGGCASGRAESHSRAGYNFSMLDSVAVVAVESPALSQEAKSQIAEFFEMELLKKGYAPKEWSTVAEALKEQELQPADLNTTEGVAGVGEIVNVPAILIVNVPHFGEEIFITAKMVDVADGSVLWIGNGTTKAEGFLSNIWGSGGGGVDESELFGGVMPGGIPAAALSPQEAENVQRLIRKMCRTLPSRLTTEW
jgi:hypothetical protein